MCYDVGGGFGKMLNPQLSHCEDVLEHAVVRMGQVICTIIFCMAQVLFYLAAISIPQTAGLDKSMV